MRRIIFVAAIATAAIAALPATAARPLTTMFTVVEQFSDPPSPGTFASDGSIVCASGTTENAAFGSGFESERGEIFHVRKTIVCDDGSGTFTLQLQARIGFNVGEMTSGPWVVLRGTGDYVNLHGRGTVAGTQFPGGVSDAYVGWLAHR